MTTKKDCVFLSVVIIYLILAAINIFVYKFLDAEYFGFILVGMLIPLIVVKKFNKNFAAWLEQPVK